MIKRLNLLFQRYSRHHRVLTLPGLALFGPDGVVTGHIETIQETSGRLTISGWSSAQRVIIHAGSVPYLAKRVPMQDAGKGANGAHSHPIHGFQLNLPATDAPIRLIQDFGAGGEIASDIALFSPSQMRSASVRLILPFLGDMLKSTGSLCALYRNKDTLARQRLKRRLGMIPGQSGLNLDHFPPTDVSKSTVALAIATLADQAPGPVKIYLSHSMGGGAEVYLQGQLAQDIATNNGAIVLRIGGISTWQIEVVTQGGMETGHTANFDVVQRILAPLASRYVIYNCGVGHTDPIELPARLLDLAKNNSKLTLLMHDYFPLSPSYMLLNGAGRYHGVPPPTDTDPGHQTRRPGGQLVTLAEWRAAWGRLIARADELRTFAQSGRDIVLQAYPDAADIITVVPHALAHPVPRLAPPATDAPVVIGVLGRIVYAKGAGVIAALSKELAQRDDVALVIFGTMDPEFPVAKGTIVLHGYDIAGLPALAARHGITMWLIPSIWPETFSFTLHEALATGLPVWTFTLGAQGEAMARALENNAPGGLIDLPDGDISAAKVLAAMGL